VEAFHREGQSTLDLLQLLQNALGTLVPSRPALRPARADIGKDQTVNQVSGRRLPAMGHRIRLDVSQLLRVGWPSRNGMCMRKSLAGLVVLRPRRLKRKRTGWSNRPSVAGLMASSEFLEAIS